MGTGVLSQKPSVANPFQFLWGIARLQPQSLRLGVAVVALLAIAALAAPLYAPHDPVKPDMANALKPPSSEHWLGTDHLGRDVFSRAAYGARISLIVGVSAVLPAALVGIGLGIVAGYRGGWLDELLMRGTDVFLAFPVLILAMGLAVALGRSLPNAVAAVSVTMLPVYARLARAQAISVRQRNFIEAARSIGVGAWRMMGRHVLPNCLDAVIAQASLDIGIAIIVIASLSFLGLGAQPPTPEWGAMILEGKIYIREAWWISTLPGLGMFIMVSGFTLLGDGLRDRLDQSN